MTDLVESGRAIDIVLVVLLAEYIWLVTRGRGALDVAFALVPAALMLLATRAALVGWGWPWIVIPLAASLPVHLADLRRRAWV